MTKCKLSQHFNKSNRMWQGDMNEIWMCDKKKKTSIKAVTSISFWKSIHWDRRYSNEPSLELQIQSVTTNISFVKKNDKSWF